MQVTASFKQVTCGTELSITQEGMPEVIPPEVCYLGWQESLMQLAKLATITTTIGVSVWYGLCSSEQSVRLAGLLSLPVPGDGARGVQQVAMGQQGTFGLAGSAGRVHQQRGPVRLGGRERRTLWRCG